MELQPLAAHEMQSHLDTHPECQFCSQRFMDGDALFTHNHNEHFTCGLCNPPARAGKGKAAGGIQMH